MGGLSDPALAKENTPGFMNNRYPLNATLPPIERSFIEWAALC
jgi:hypothetical protein